jgi:orotidine-5'-phosphate decarboxylase
MPRTKRHPVSSKDRIVFALDFLSFKESKPYIQKLKNRVGLFKVGLALLFSEGIKIVDKIHDLTGGQKVFLDIKFTKTDIPQQMLGVLSVLAASSRGIKFITVHTHQDEKNIQEVVEKFKNGTKVLGVTVLTSVSGEEAQSLLGADVLNRVVTLSGIARNAGCHGVVCSGYEAKAVRSLLGPDFIIVTPGIRPSWQSVKNDDQRRATTPTEAILNGADYLVVGRPIALHKDPAGAADKIADEIAEALEQRE